MACTCTYIFPARNDTQKLDKSILDRRDLKASRLVASITFDGIEFHTFITRSKKNIYL